jgi:hypothetical protein
MLQYCDKIAHIAGTALREDETFMAGPTKSDLHPVEGYLVSTKKTIEVLDCNGQRYRVTVEALED